MKVRQNVLVCLVYAGLINFVLMLIAGICIGYGVMFFAVAMKIYTVDQFLIWSTCLAFGIICFANLFIIKCGHYRSIMNNVKE
jgi:hypothetical protein